MKEDQHKDFEDDLPYAMDAFKARWAALFKGEEPSFQDQWVYTNEYLRCRYGLRTLGRLRE